MADKESGAIDRSSTSTDATEHTHYCDDCDEPLALLYDDREDDETPVQCGHCAGYNTRSLQPDAEQGGSDGR